MVSTRAFARWEDLGLMQAVCSAGLCAAPGRALAHPGDIAWWAGWPPSAMDELARSFLLWEADGEVVGFAGRSPEDGDFSVFISPTLLETEAALEFEEAALGWASDGGVPVRWVNFEDETAAVRRWEARGYRPIPGGYMNLVRSIGAADAAAEPDERVQPVTQDDIEDRASITHSAFENDKPLADYVADYRRFYDSPAHPHGEDLLLRDTDGRPAACCIAWTDPISRAATFEPVAVHPDLHRRGFATALLQEGLRRLAEAGMTYAIVGANTENPRAEALYRSVGFVPDRLLREYERPEGSRA